MSSISTKGTEHIIRLGRPKRPCRRCGSIERRENGRLACENSHRRASRASDPSYRERANRYQRTHAEKLRTAGTRRVIKRRSGATREYKATRRELERNPPGFHKPEQLAVILRAQGGHCAYCSERTV